MTNVLLKLILFYLTFTMFILFCFFVKVIIKITLYTQLAQRSIKYLTNKFEKRFY